MQQTNPVAFMILFLCVGPFLLTAFGFWLGRGGPLPGGRRLHVGLTQRGYRDDDFSD